MTCHTPLKAYRAPGGGVVFKSSEGYVDRPVSLNCGQCIGCRLARATAWALRSVHEASLHTQNCFVTLTYSPEQVPADGGLRIRDWQLFAKRVRKELGSFRFLHCGEYGESSFRPHYHACVFGLDFHRPDWAVFQRKHSGDVFTSPLLTSLWGLGHATVGDLTFQSAAYVARYVMKKVTGDRSDDAFRRIDVSTGEEFYVTPEYVTMSRRPGLGSEWFERYKSDVFPSDEVIHDGKRFPVPDFYLSRLEASDPDLHEIIRLQRRRRLLETPVAPARALDASTSQLGNAMSRLRPGTGVDLTPERLSTRERVTKARLGLQPRDTV